MPSVSAPIFGNGMRKSTGCRSWRQWSESSARRVIGGRTPERARQGAEGGGASSRRDPFGGGLGARRIAADEDGVEATARVGKVERQLRAGAADELRHPAGGPEFVDAPGADVLRQEIGREVEVVEAAVG